MTKEPIAVGYCRLSDDDPNVGESVSIGHQRSLIESFCRDQGIDIIGFYTDDGYTGTNFDRPDFKRMMEDIERGKANTIIVKDISRFGREEANVLNYIERILPEKNIGFVAITDQVSSLDSQEFSVSNWMQLHFRVLFNEYFPADTSHKVREVMRSKALNGEFIGSQAPYGYAKSKEDKHKLVIDPMISPIVVKIFEMAAYSGYGYNKIARELSKMKIMVPSAVTAQRENRAYVKDPYDWNLNSVKVILENPVYLGTLISGKKHKLNFKSKKVVFADKKKWIVNENMHEPIITEQLWNDAHEKLDSRKRMTKSGFENIFAGLIKCEDCGYALGITNSNRAKNYFSCNTYRKKGMEVCESHLIRYDVLYDIVLADIQRVLDTVLADPDKFRSSATDAIKSKMFDRKLIESQISNLETEIEKDDKRVDTLYEDRLNGIITPEKFRELTERFQEDSRVKRDRLYSLQKELEEVEKKYSAVDKFLETIGEYSHIDSLDKEILNRLVSRITVGKRMTDSDNNVTQRVTIYYKFLGSLGAYKHTFN